MGLDLIRLFEAGLAESAACGPGLVEATADVPLVSWICSGVRP